jgi:hypothetical protein
MASNASTAFAGTGTSATGASITLNTAGLAISVVAGGGGAALQGSGTFSQNTGTVQFANSNGVTFGLTNGSMTASVQTAYQSTGAYLTTAMQSGASASFAGTGSTLTTTTGTAVAMTFGTGGLNLAVPPFLTTAQPTGAYLTTAMASNASTAFAGTSTGMTGGSVTLNTSGIAISLPNYLTTAALSANTSNYAGTSTGATGASVTLNTSGIALSLPAYLTTAALSANTSNYAGTASGATNCSVTVNTSGVSINLPNYLTTAMQSASSSNFAGTALTNTTTAGSAVGATYGTGGLNIAFPAFITTAALSANTSNYAGTGFTSTTTGGTAIVATNNTAGLSLNFPAFLTTAALSANTSNYAGTGFTSTTTAGTAIVATHNTAGLSLNYPAWITTAALSANTSNYAGTGTAITGGSVTLNTTGLTLKIPIATLSYFENLPIFEPGTTTVSAGGSVLQIVPFVLPQALSASFLRVPVSMSVVSTSATGTTANTSFTFNRSYTDAYVIYTQGGGASSLSLQSITSSSCSWLFQTSISAGNTGSQWTCTFNATYPSLGSSNSNYATNFATTDSQFDISTGSLSLFNGLMFADLMFPVSLSAGNYWLGFGRSTNSASNAGPAALSGGSIGVSTLGVSQPALTIGYPGVATNSSIQMQPGLGSWSTNAAILTTGSLALASISSVVNSPKPYFQFIRRA